MATSRTRRASSRAAADPSGGNVLFTLGLVSVVALLIVGYVMTNGGITGTNNDDNSDNNTITILTTPTPVPASPTTALTAQANSIISGQITEMQTKIDTLQSDKTSLEQQLTEAKQQHQNELADLKFRIQILMDENNKLSEKLKGKS